MTHSATRVRRVIVVGGGLASLMTTIKLCEAGVPVDLISLVPVKRSHSVCAQGGINASIQLEEIACGGDFLANQPPIKGMVEAAPGIMDMLDRMGVPFHRAPEGQQILHALDEQVRRLETVDVRDELGVTVPGERMVRKHEFWDFLGAVLDDSGACVGCVAQDLRSMQIRAFTGDAVVLATGGCGVIFGRSTMSVICTGTAASAVYQQGAIYANGEFIQVHPTAVPGADKLRPIPESARREGGRVWVPKDPKDRRDPRDIPEKERDYLLERMYPDDGNLVPCDIASRAIFKACVHEGRGILHPETGKNELEVYLDLTHIDEKLLRARLAGALEICEKFAGVDPCRSPMRVSPAVHCSMGGLWVDFEPDASGSLKVGSPRNHATSIPGLYAAGEVEYQYHGANRLGDSALLSCIYGGMVTGPAVASYRESLRRSAFDAPRSIFEEAEGRHEEGYQRILTQNQGGGAAENAYRLHAELGESMLRDCTIERDNAALDGVIGKIGEIEERLGRVRCTDTSARMNQGAPFVRHLSNMVVLARVIAEGARRRDESRGAHYKPASPRRDDAAWLRTTLARHGGPGTVQLIRGFDYSCAGQTVHVTDAVDTSLVAPRERRYEQEQG